MRRVVLPIQSFRLKNFKAVRDSKVVKFTPLTVFIGNNGAGKSSIIEGMETLQSIVGEGLDNSMRAWRGLEHIWNQAVRHNPIYPTQGRPYQENGVSFDVRGYNSLQWKYHALLEVNASPGGNEIFIHREQYGHREDYESYSRSSRHNITRNAKGEVFYGDDKDNVSSAGDDGSVMKNELYGVYDWQFVSLAPQEMGSPKPQKRTGGEIRLAKDGSNIAEYLLSIRRLDERDGTSVLDGIVETLRYVLPYARDVQSTLTSELERTVYLQLTEGEFKIPGWLLSTGTLRILSLLALLRHPSPPPVIIVEEIENGLDPRTIDLLVEEIRYAVQNGTTQVILTTHSPYLLDLLTLSQIIVVERDENDSPVFTRPADDEAMQKWAERFSPGRLYTMNQLGRKPAP